MNDVVLDTNVLASGIVRHNPASPPVQLLDLWRAGTYSLVVSEGILDELARTFTQPYFARRLRPEEITAALWLLRQAAT